MTVLNQIVYCHFNTMSRINLIERPVFPVNLRLNSMRSSSQQKMDQRELIRNRRDYKNIKNPASSTYIADSQLKCSFTCLDRYANIQYAKIRWNIFYGHPNRMFFARFKSTVNSAQVEPARVELSSNSEWFRRSIWTLVMHFFTPKSDWHSRHNGIRLTRSSL